MNYFNNVIIDEYDILVGKPINILKFKVENLSTISLKGNYRNTKGFVYTFLSKIAIEGINVVDMISTNSQFTFIVEEKDALKVYKICREVKKNCQ